MQVVGESYRWLRIWDVVRCGCRVWVVVVRTGHLREKTAHMPSLKYLDNVKGVDRVRHTPRYIPNLSLGDDRHMSIVGLWAWRPGYVDNLFPESSPLLWSINRLSHPQRGVSASILNTNYMYTCLSYLAEGPICAIFGPRYNLYPRIKVLTSLLLILQLYNQQVVLLSGDVTDYHYHL